MNLGPCSQCKEVNIVLSSDKINNAVRTIIGSRRRFCPNCGYKWLDKVNSPKPVWVWALAAMVVLGGAVFFVRSLDSEHRGKNASKRPRGTLKTGGTAASGLAKGAGATAKDAAAGASEDLAAADSERGEGAGEGGQDAGGEAEGESLIEVDQSDDGGSPGLLEAAGDIMKVTMSLVKKPGGMGGSGGPSSGEIEKMDKKELWKKYGHMFGSKEDAKKQYTEHLKKKKAEEAQGK